MTILDRFADAVYRVEFMTAINRFRERQMKNAGEFWTQRGFKHVGAARLFLLVIPLLLTMPSSVRAQNTQQGQASLGSEPLVRAANSRPGCLPHW